MGGLWMLFSFMMVFLLMFICLTVTALPSGGDDAPRKRAHLA